MAPIVKGYATMTELKTGMYSLDEWLELHEAIADMAVREKEQMEQNKT